MYLLLQLLWKIQHFQNNLQMFTHISVSPTVLVAIRNVGELSATVYRQNKRMCSNIGMLQHGSRYLTGRKWCEVLYLITHAGRVGCTGIKHKTRAQSSTGWHAETCLRQLHVPYLSRLFSQLLLIQYTASRTIHNLSRQHRHTPSNNNEISHTSLICMFIYRRDKCIVA